MKKLPFLLSVLLIAAMLLASCASGNNNGEKQGTPGALGTDSGMVGTPAAAGTMGAAAVGTSLPGMATQTLAPTGAVDAPATSTPAVGQTLDLTTGTPAASGTGIPVTGANQCAPTRLSKFMGLKVRDSANVDFGSVAGIVLLRDLVGSQSAATTPAAGVTPKAVDDNPKSDNKSDDKSADNSAAMTFTGKSVAPSIAYVIVDQEKEANGKSILVPFKAFDAKFFTQPAARNDCALTLTVTSSALASAPLFDRANMLDFSAAAWDKDFSSFWVNQGLSIPATGAVGSGKRSAFMMNDKFNDLDVMSPNNDKIGTVKDFIVNPTDGSLQYAALATGGFLGLGEKYVLVPTTQMHWVSDDAANKNDNGHLVMNLTNDSLKSVPTIDDLNALDITTPAWDKDIQTFWGSFNPTGAMTTPAATQTSK